MSYVDNLTEEELKTFIVIDDWIFYFHGMIEEAGYGIKSFEPIQIRKAIIKSEVLLTGKYGFDLRFELCYFQKSISMVNANFQKSLTFSNCFCDETVSAAMGSTFDLNFNIFSSLFQKFLILDAKFNRCFWHVGDCKECIIAEGDFQELLFSVADNPILKLILGSPKLKGSIIISALGSEIKHLHIQNTSKNLILSLEDLSSDQIILDRCRNESGLRFSNVKPSSIESEFSISNSYLGKAEFYSVDFKSFNEVNILNSFIVDAVFVNVAFSDNINAFSPSNDRNEYETKLVAKVLLLERRHKETNIRKAKVKHGVEFFEYYNKKRETLRQIKFALSKQGDVVNEQRFHSLEMKAHDRSLGCSKSFWTKFIIKASSWTSNFGQSVHKPLICLLIGHFILFIIVLIYNKLQPLQLSFLEPTWEGFWMGFHEYFRLINPLRRAGETFAGGFIFIDLLMRIWASYMIYNIIRASRRFIK